MLNNRVSKSKRYYKFSCAVGFLCLILALIAYLYAETTTVPFIGTVETYPMREYALPMFLIGFTILEVSSTALHLLDIMTEEKK